MCKSDERTQQNITSCTKLQNFLIERSDAINVIWKPPADTYVILEGCQAEKHNHLYFASIATIHGYKTITSDDFNLYTNPPVLKQPPAY